MITRLLLAGMLAAGLSRPALAQNGRPSCLTPIKYRIGSLDSRFGITRTDFQRRVEEAAALWSAAAGRKLFNLDSGARLQIDLVYDGRQETTQRLVAGRARISEKLKQADRIKDQLAPLQDKFHALDKSYSDQASSYHRAVEAYNRVVGQWNAKGGVPEGEEQYLRSEAALLREQDGLLRERRGELNRMVGDINQLVQQYNTLLQTANVEANMLNGSVPLGAEFEEGRYIRQLGEERIEIFEYDGETALAIILAHEMGHALGIRHNANPASIMSPLVHTRELALTADDMQGLKTACSLR
jgi:hypothetical protein